MERTQDGDIVAQYEKAQESWFAHAPSPLAQMGDAVVEQHEGPGHASPAYHPGIEKWDAYYATVGVTRATIGDDPRTPRERLSELRRVCAECHSQGFELAVGCRADGVPYNGCNFCTGRA